MAKKQKWKKSELQLGVIEKVGVATVLDLQSEDYLGIIVKHGKFTVHFTFTFDEAMGMMRLAKANTTDELKGKQCVMLNYDKNRSRFLCCIPEEIEEDD